MSIVFHVSLLKKYTHRCGLESSAPPPAVLDDGKTERDVDEVLVDCDTKTGRRLYYMQWRSN